MWALRTGQAVQTHHGLLSDLVCFGAVLRTGCGGSEQKPGGSAGAGMEWEWACETLESQDVLTDGR